VKTHSTLRKRAQEGIVVGGGVALLRAGKVLDNHDSEDPDVRTA
jgi:hypothetical protein